VTAYQDIYVEESSAVCLCGPLFSLGMIVMKPSFFEGKDL